VPEDSLIQSAVKQRFSDRVRYRPDEARTVDVKPFLWGKIHQIRFPRVQGAEKTVFAWEPERDALQGEAQRENIVIFEDQSEIVSFVSMYQPQIIAKAGKIARHNFLAKFTPVDLISGIIAVLLMLTIIFVIVFQLLANKDVKLPELLFSALTSIIGFYFGKSKSGEATTDVQKF
jgi:hypothetical protein